MLDWIIKHHRNKTIFMKDDDIAFVKALIAGEPSRCPEEKKFLFHIVANKTNGIDVDKLDYIQRDSRMLGEPMSISLTRILKSARVIKDEICYNIKDADSIYNICAARFRLHKVFYNHKSAKAIEYMIVDALLSADPHLKISDRVFDPDRFLHLSDVIMNNIEESTAPELAKARAIFTRIRERDLYRCVDYKVVDWNLNNLFRAYITPEKIVEAIRKLPPRPPRPSVQSSGSGDTLGSTSAEGEDEQDGFGGYELTVEDERDVESELIDPPTPCTSGGDVDVDMEGAEGGGSREGEGEDEEDELTADDIIVDFATMHHGMGPRNPLDNVKFYAKRKMNEATTAGPGVFSGLLPPIFAEVMLRIYTKKPRYWYDVQSGFRALLEEMDRDIGEDGVLRASEEAAAPTAPTSGDGAGVLKREGTTASEVSTVTGSTHGLGLGGREGSAAPTVSAAEERDESGMIVPPVTQVAGLGGALSFDGEDGFEDGAATTTAARGGGAGLKTPTGGTKPLPVDPSTPVPSTATTAAAALSATNARASSLGLGVSSTATPHLPGGTKRPFGRTPSAQFAANTFTTVEPDFVPDSPLSRGKSGRLVGGAGAAGVVGGAGRKRSFVRNVKSMSEVKFGGSTSGGGTAVMGLSVVGNSTALASTEGLVTKGLKRARESDGVGVGSGGGGGAEGKEGENVGVVEKRRRA
ncbi:metal-dependent phosphohydrolase [Coprinopsis cinerea okayama7|uniref:Metal-dependent phosphohydrolase n=1 Tax=Coprinopsis cinerea (strain Okayama-7 / 130 / ATCC MYA-4618 / FGSC 9003) TaxID=240176 RepID=A8P7K5_COPC7|nr:metal-dependent phosphohydrolase [Coprinopsis cinerea okayama7\|eukprot:XP_001839381.2 metal-dependent phosphohydrolase [Coprinopsis cinerea okayama7\